MKRTLIIFLFVITGIISCTKEPSMSENDKNLASATTAPIVDEMGLGQKKVILKTIYGNIVFKFYPTKAPITVNRIETLINQEFYNGLTFHRVVPNFVIQTGDPTATGTGGTGQKLKAEFNDIQHIKGSVAMARASDPDSADSQFYIALGTLNHLDGQYTIFGKVIEGLSVLDQIKQGDKILSMVVVGPSN